MKEKRILLELIFISSFTALPYLSIGGMNLSDKLFFMFFCLFASARYNAKIIVLGIKRFKYLSLWATANFFSIIFARYTATAVFFAANYLFQAVFFITLTLFMYYSRLNYIKILKIIFFWSVFVATIGIVEYHFFEAAQPFLRFFKEALYTNAAIGQVRVASLFDNPNPFGIFMSISFTLGIILWLMENKGRYIILDSVIFLGILYSGTRMAIINAGFGTLLAIYHARKFKKFASQKKRIHLVFIGILGIVLCLKLGYLRRFAFLLEGIVTGNWSMVTNKRAELWTQGLLYWKEHPVFGIGGGNFQPLYTNEFGNSLGLHSLYLSVLIENGICGFAAFSAFLITTYKKGQTLQDDKEHFVFVVLLPALLFSQVTEMHLTHIYPFVFLFWFIISIPYRNIWKTQGGR